MRLHLLFSCSVLLRFSLLVRGQDYDPVKDFCRRFSHQGAVVGNKLYIDGGQLNIVGQGGRNFTNTRLLYHDLTTINRGAKILGMPPLVTNLTKGAEVPSVIGGYLWADDVNGKFYLYGGEFVDRTPDTFALWCYDVYADSWLKIKADDGINRISFGAGTIDKYAGKGYYMGGWLGDHNVFDWQGGRRASAKLVTYDMIENTWQNDTGPNDGVARAEGVMQYIPAGDGGMLIYFGGVRVPGGAESAQVAAPMNQMDIFDVASSKWYTQNATGTIPEPRRRFCSGVAVAQDSSSYNIYIYGGLGFPPNSNGFDDAYILSIPSFTWTKIFPIGDRKESDAYPHFDLTCNVVNNAQMLIVGGIFPKDMGAKTCDAPDVAGVHNLNMGKDDKEKVFWSTFNPNTTTYQVPLDLLNVIGGVPTGAAKVATPASGFNNLDLKTLFGRVADVKPRAATRTPPGQFSSPPTPNNKKSSTNKAVIIGPVVGGIALLVGATWIYFCVLKKRKAAAAAAANPAPAARDPQVSGPETPVLASAFTTNYPMPPSSPPPPFFGGQYPQQHQQMHPGQYQDASYPQPNHPGYKQPQYVPYPQYQAHSPIDNYDQHHHLATTTPRAQSPAELPFTTSPPPKSQYPPPPIPAAVNERPRAPSIDTNLHNHGPTSTGFKQ